MKYLVLPILPPYSFFGIPCTKGDGTKIDPSAISLIVYEDTGADATTSTTQITGSPFTPTKQNSKTGWYGQWIAKSLFADGKVYLFLWEATIDSITTHWQETYVATAKRFLSLNSNSGYDV